MPDHRRSYLRTTVGAALAAAVAFAALIWLVGMGVGRWNEKTAAGRIIGTIAGMAAPGILLLSGLVLAGGSIASRRDSSQTFGKPYAARRPGDRKAGRLARGISAVRRAWDTVRGGGLERLHLVPGEFVEIRPLEEILATLDGNGAFDALPFMPEMASWCGRRVRVLRRVDKVYDWISTRSLRRLRDTVFLEGVRCGGGTHGGCQADCQLLWKEVWLGRVGGREAQPSEDGAEGAGLGKDAGMVAGLELSALKTRIGTDPASLRYVCQMTELPRALSSMSWNDPRHYLRDLASGNVRPGPFWTGLALRVFNVAQRRLGQAQFPVREHGGGGARQATAAEALGLRPGESVKVKSKREIEATLDKEYRNRGLWFDADMMRFCGGLYRVSAIVSRQIDEKSGRMLSFSVPAVVLEDVTATGEYLAFALLNERIYWRECWLERADAQMKAGVGPQLFIL